MKDPHSAQVQIVAGPAFFFHKGGLFGAPIYGWGICFEVNAKNGFGAYTGFRRMAVAWRHGTVQRVYGDMRDNVFDQALTSAACQTIRDSMTANPPNSATGLPRSSL